jgi:hypothetical protein
MLKQNSVTLFGAGILGTIVVGLISSTVVQYAPINVSAQTTNNNTRGLAASPQQAKRSGLLNTTSAAMGLFRT